MKKTFKLLSAICLVSMLVGCGGNNDPGKKQEEETWPKVLTVEKNETQISELMSKGVSDTLNNLGKGFTLQGNLSKFDLKFDLGAIGQMLSLPTVSVASAGAFEFGAAFPQNEGAKLKDIDLGFKLNDSQINAKVAIGEVEIPFAMDKASISTYVDDFKIYSDMSNANFVTAFEKSLDLIGFGRDSDAKVKLANYICQKQLLDVRDFLPAKIKSTIEQFDFPSIKVDSEKIKEAVNSLITFLKGKNFGDLLTVTVQKDGSSEINLAVTADMKDRLVSLFITDPTQKQQLQTFIDAITLVGSVRIVLDASAHIQSVALKTNIACNVVGMMDVKLDVDATFALSSNAYVLPELVGYGKNVALNYAPIIKNTLKNTVKDLNNVSVSSDSFDADLALKQDSTVTLPDGTTYSSSDWDIELGACLNGKIVANNLTDKTKPTQFYLGFGSKDAYAGETTFADSSKDTSVLYDGDKVYVDKDDNFNTYVTGTLAYIPQLLKDEYGLSDLSAMALKVLGVLKDKTYGAGFEDVNLKLPEELDLSALVDSLDDSYFNIAAFVLYPFMGVDLANNKITLDISYEVTDEFKALVGLVSTFSNTVSPFGEGDNYVDIEIEIGVGNFQNPSIKYLDIKNLEVSLDIFTTSTGTNTEKEEVVTIVRESVIFAKLNGKIDLAFGSEAVMPTISAEEKTSYKEDAALTSILTNLAKEIGKRTEIVDISLPYI